MSLHILEPTEIEACGNIAKIIKEFVGLLNTKNENISIAKMESPGGWEEPGQSPEFDEYTLVLRGMLRVQTRLETFDVKAGEGFISQKGEWIKYSTPESEGVEYIAVCQPAFSPDTVHRDE